MAQVVLPDAVGINHLADETSMVEEEVMFLRDAENVDIDVDGNINRRKGYTQLLAGTGYHSIKNTQRGWLMLCNKESLGIFDPVTDTFTALATMAEAYLTSYTEENGILYAMNPSFSCLFKPADTTAYDLGVDLPNVIPDFAANTSGGTLLAGDYGITYSLVDADGEESGLGPVVKISLSSQGHIAGTMFTVISGYSYRIYMTDVDGDELYQAAEFDADTVSFDIMDHELGRQPATQGLEPTPLGHIVRAYNSRLLIASTNFAYFTEAFRPHLHDPAHGFVATSGFTTMIEPVGKGVFIADTRGVKFYAGEDPMEWKMLDVSPDPVVFGTSMVVPGSYFSNELAQFDEIAIWLSVSGYQLGLPNGEVVKINAEQVRLPQYVQGCSAFAIRDGRKQIVTPVDSNVLASASAALDSSIS
jgi:hypothetical protein